MGIGTGIFFIVAGSVLLWAVDFDLPYIDDDGLAMIAIVAGLAILVVSMVMKTNRPEAGIGTGIFLLAAGAVMAFALNVDLPYVADYTLGVIFLVAGAIAIIATALVNLNRRNARNAMQPDQPAAPYQQQAYQPQPGQQPQPYQPPPGQQPHPQQQPNQPYQY